MKLDYLRRPIVVLLTVPAFIALGIGLLPLGVVWLEQQFAKGTLSPYVLQMGAESARTLLSVIAGGAMTALSLTYSLVLVVFTLAAGNIGPRLLKRFTSDLVNQITAGIFGGTFLYALLTILFVGDDFVPKGAITLAVVLAVLSVFQLIYFVREVSKSVTIDDEIASIKARLREALKAGFQSDPEEKGGREEAKKADRDFNPRHEICSPLSGYVGTIDQEAIARLAREQDVVLKLQVPKGGYLVKGEALLAASSSVDETFEEACFEHLRVEPARSSEIAIDFSTNLLVEIGLRALSPGVNDTFTALAAVDALSGALSEIVEHDSRPLHNLDEDGSVRLIQPGLSPAKLIDDAFSPLRRASSNNILMAEGLARALGRLYIHSGKEAKAELVRQTALLCKVLRKSGQFDFDIERVGSFLPGQLRKEFT